VWAPQSRRRALRLLAFTLAGVVAGAGAEPGSQNQEYSVKAAFLYNFAKFVEWPERAFASTGAPFCIGIVGQDPFGSVLEDIIRPERVSGRRLEVRRFGPGQAPSSCQVLFVSLSEKDRLAPTLQKLEDQPVLTVSEIDHFAESGGMIRLTVTNGKVGFEINPQRAERAQLKISSKLLQLARIVSEPPARQK
jgi:hypothetical protein